MSKTSIISQTLNHIIDHIADHIADIDIDHIADIEEDWKDLNEWTVDDMCKVTLMCNFTEGEKICSNLRENGVNGQFFLELSEKDCQTELGLKKIQVKRLTLEILKILHSRDK